MLLCIDIGNTNIKLGLFRNDEMVQRWRISTDRTNLADEYGVLIGDLFETRGLSIHEITGCAISSVVPSLTQEFIEMSEKYFLLSPTIYGPEVNIGMKINTDYPSEVGHDLIMNALAARKLYGKPVIIVGFGTATSFVAVSESGNLEGVAIGPGVVSSSESLFRGASTLPRVALAHPQVAIGKNTIQSMRSGIVYGFVGMVKEVVTRMKKEMSGNPKVIATGGVAALIAPECDEIDIIQTNLALLGLKEMFELSQQ
ncbi:MAG: pantothenate kinase [Chloroflexi bacterium HGW-Chloroflexi-2]|jgi:type III pantothenate kinase|nr:MAG: pantothenate kinase [Chloroflexi bacterium HGW-Chloroflexi-2]